MKQDMLMPVFIKSIPANPESGNLYISMEYRTAVHRCPCGCGAKVVTPIGPNDWTLKFNAAVTLRPSVGSGQQACRSHYFVTENRIEWLRPISERDSRSASSRDRSAHAAPAAPESTCKPWWRTLLNRVRRNEPEGM